MMDLYLAYEVVTPWADSDMGVDLTREDLPLFVLEGVSSIMFYRKQGRDPSACPTHLGRG